jgi:predicted nucleotidyltransferase
VSVELLERGAAALADVLDEVVFVGGATLVLWITDPDAPPPRPTKDVDVIIEVTSRLAWHRFEGRLRKIGFREDRESGVICRWRHRDDPDLILDAMPARAELMGFANRWQEAALPHAVSRALPGSTMIRAVSPPYLVATKLEAFASRGGGDLLGSRDLEDLVSLIDGRAELVDEVTGAPDDVRAFLAERFGQLLDDRDFGDAVYGLVRGDAASQARVEETIVPRMRAMVGRAAR